MPTKTDTKVEGEVRTNARAIAEAIPLVKDYTDSKREKGWAMLFKATEQTQRFNFNLEKLRTIWKEAFCKAYAIPVKGRSDDVSYNNFVHDVNTIIQLAVYFKDKHDEMVKWHESGYSIWHIWTKIKGLDKTSKEKKAEAKANIQDRREEAEALRAVGNVQAAKVIEEELVKEEEKASPAIVEEQKEEIVSKSWSAKPIDANKRWIKECFQILRHDPKVFVEMIEHINGKHMLSDRVSNLLISEVQKKYKEAYSKS